MNIIVVGGFLGSGKTTLLKALIDTINEEYWKNENNKIAVIENEIGKIGIDEKILKRKNYTVKELFKGCICCTISTELIDSLKEIEENEKPEWIIIESTGLAKPKEIIENIRNYFPRKNRVMNCIIVDALRWMKLQQVVGDLVLEQINEADIIFINKIDLVSSTSLNNVIKDIENRKNNSKPILISAKNNAEELKNILVSIIEGKQWKII